MPGSVTPARRRRDTASSSESSTISPFENEAEETSNRSKRVRLNECSDNGNETGSDSVGSPQRSVLPDTFRRTPQAPNKARVRGAVGNNAHGFQPGAIVRVALKNFVTYTEAEFHCGPNLNMVIGPNGTGKSTLVCAICLGLGAHASLLGRAKDVSEFVKHGSRRAEVQIELAANTEREDQNPTVTLRIEKDGGKCSFLINNRNSTRKAVQELARSYSIQIDNLCQFLPQDRVVEFAALSPIELLAQTQRAAAPDYVSAWHEDLKSMGKKEKEQREDLQTLQEQLKAMEERQKSQEGEVGRMRERSELQAKSALLERLRPFSEYTSLRTQFKQVKEQRKAADRCHQQLSDRIAPNVATIAAKTAAFDNMSKRVVAKQNVINRMEQVITEKASEVRAFEEDVQSCEQKMTAEKKSTKNAKADILRRHKDIQSFQHAMTHPPAPFDSEHMNAQIRQKQQRIRAIQVEQVDLKEDSLKLTEEIKRRQDIITQAESTKEQLQSQAGRQMSKLEQASQDTAKAWKWVQRNRDKFTGDVFGPPIMECSVKDKRHIDAVEQVIGRSDLLAVTVSSQEDFGMLSHQIYTVMKLTDVNLRSSLQPLASFRSPMPAEQLLSFGLQAWVLDLLDGPEPVLAMLCDNKGLERTAFGTRDLSDSQSNAVRQSRISSWVAAGQYNVISRRQEYGDHGVSIRSVSVKKARLLTDTPVDAQIELEIDGRIREARLEISSIKEQLGEVGQKQHGLHDELTQLEQEVAALREEKRQKQLQKSEFDALPTKLESAQDKLNNVQGQIRESLARLRQFERDGDTYCFKKCQSAIDHARLLTNIRDLHMQLLEAQIMKIEAQSDLQQLQTKHEQELRSVEEKKEEALVLKHSEDDLLRRARAAQDRCVAIQSELTEEEAAIMSEVNGWEPDQFETEIQSHHAQLEMLQGGANANAVRDFEERARKIGKHRDRVAELESCREKLAVKIAALKQQWEPEVDQLVEKISEAFAENFSRMHCAGEVAIYKDDDFEKWAIQIRVKFREVESLSVLDSHRQSGGERAVSTIYYLMALQSLARAPFRVVDEINQGMDPRNERLVHSRMVEIACAEHTSQYFLITPKLLSGLTYHPKMRVHCIASGEYMPTKYQELDFGMLAKKALSIRAAAG